MTPSAAAKLPDETFAHIRCSVKNDFPLQGFVVYAFFQPEKKEGGSVLRTGDPGANPVKPGAALVGVRFVREMLCHQHPGVLSVGNPGGEQEFLLFKVDYKKPLLIRRNGKINNAENGFPSPVPLETCQRFLKGGRVYDSFQTTFLVKAVGFVRRDGRQNWRRDRRKTEKQGPDQDNKLVHWFLELVCDHR